jgi:nucleotide-binding universal stress UspA family protein
VGTGFPNKTMLNRSEVIMTKRVVVATDGSTAAARAVDFAVTVAKAWDAGLIVLTISTALSPAELRELAQADHNLGTATDTLVRRIMDGASARANHHGVVDIKTLSMSGDPASVTLKIALEEQADLIVVGRRGLGGLARLLLGSVSEKIVTHAHCAVTVVP